MMGSLENAIFLYYIKHIKWEYCANGNVQWTILCTWVITKLHTFLQQQKKLIVNTCFMHTKIYCEEDTDPDARKDPVGLHAQAQT